MSSNVISLLKCAVAAAETNNNCNRNYGTCYTHAELTGNRKQTVVYRDLRCVVGCASEAIALLQN